MQNKPITDCSSLFENCLCSFYRESQRNFLYCNHPSVSHIPDFRAIEKLIETNVKPKNEKANLIFAKLDFSGSSIRKIHKDDLSYLKLDVFNQNVENRSSIMQILTPRNDYTTVAGASNNTSETSVFETFLEQLKKVLKNVVTRFFSFYKLTLTLIYV